MIKADELREFRPTYRYEDGESITLDAIRTILIEDAQKNGIPIAFYPDQVKSGGMFNKTIEDCLVMYNPEHQDDYFSFCIRVQRQGNMTYILINDFGSSKQMDKYTRSEYAKEDRKGKSMSYQIGSMIGSGIRNMGKNKQKYEEEMNYYNILINILDDVIS